MQAVNSIKFIILLFLSILSSTSHCMLSRMIGKRLPLNNPYITNKNGYAPGLRLKLRAKSPYLFTKEELEKLQHEESFKHPGYVFYDPTIRFIDQEIQLSTQKYENYLKLNACVRESKEEADSKERNEIISKALENNTFMSFSKFMDLSLFDEKFGYYSTKGVQFKHQKNLKADFSTWPTDMSPNFGEMIAYHAYCMWFSMVSSKEIKKNEKFNIVEFGGGDGTLAFDVLSSIQRFAIQETEKKIISHWNEFYEIVHYIIGERSADLSNRQKIKNDKFLKLGKFEVIDADARNNEVFKKLNLNGLILSNELLDAFPVHKVLQLPDGRIKICISIPALNREFLSAFSEEQIKYLKEKGEENFKVFVSILSNKEEMEIYNKVNKNKINNIDDLILTAEDWVEIKRNLTAEQRDFFDKQVKFVELYVDPKFFPEIQNYIQRHKGYIKFMLSKIAKDQPKFWYLNNGVENYFNSVSQILKSGFILTIDYGHDSTMHDYHMENPADALRTFCEDTQHNVELCYAHPGKVDITTDVNFTDIDILSRNLGLQTIAFLHQCQLENHLIQVNDNVFVRSYELENPNFFVTIPSYDCLEKFRNKGFFKAMIQAKTNRANKYAVFTRSLPLFPSFVFE